MPIAILKMRFDAYFFHSSCKSESIYSWFLLANCPQAASISLPRERRTVIETPFFLRYCAKASYFIYLDFTKSTPSTGLYSITFTLAEGTLLHSFNKFCASSRLSLNPSKAIYSNVILLSLYDHRNNIKPL